MSIETHKYFDVVMNEIIKITCPNDRTVLSVRLTPGIESKNITCPVCRYSFPVSILKNGSRNGKNGIHHAQVTEVNPLCISHADTLVHNYHSDTIPHQYQDKIATELYQVQNQETESAPDIVMPVGRLFIVGTGDFFQLEPGVNVIGRKATQSGATLQIDTGGSRALSREHIVIDVIKESTGLGHYISLYKEKVNTTFVGGQQLIFGEQIRLNNGDTIRLPDVNLRFELSDGEATEIQFH